MIPAFAVGPVHVGAGPLFLIAGPCVIESETHARRMADALQRITADLSLAYIFKASYDKANRTSVSSFRGPGLVEGTRILRAIREANQLPTLTDVHEPGHCAVAAEGADVLQIPAFLCRQTDLLVAAGETGRAVNVKKGQFVAPGDMRYAVEKIRSTRNDRISLTERGATFGYGNLVVDMRSLAIMRPLAPVVFDGTHSVQMPSANNGVSGGQPEFIPVLARAAVAAGIDGLFLEVHDNPAEAKSDGANALRLDQLKPLLENLLALHALAPRPGRLRARPPAREAAPTGAADAPSCAPQARYTRHEVAASRARGSCSYLGQKKGPSFGGASLPWFSRFGRELVRGTAKATG